jgi:hypothetical protein
VTQTPTVTPTISVTTTPSVTPTISISTTPSITPTVTPTISVTQTPTVTPTISETPSVTPTPTISETPSVTPTISITPTPTTPFSIVSYALAEYDADGVFLDNNLIIKKNTVDVLNITDDASGNVASSFFAGDVVEVTAYVTPGSPVPSSGTPAIYLKIINITTGVTVFDNTQTYNGNNTISTSFTIVSGNDYLVETITTYDPPPTPTPTPTISETPAATPSITPTPSVTPNQCACDYFAIENVGGTPMTVQFYDCRNVLRTLPLGSGAGTNICACDVVPQTDLTIGNLGPCPPASPTPSPSAVGASPSPTISITPTASTPRYTITVYANLAQIPNSAVPAGDPIETVARVYYRRSLTNLIQLGGNVTTTSCNLVSAAVGTITGLSMGETINIGMRGWSTNRPIAFSSSNTAICANNTGYYCGTYLDANPPAVGGRTITVTGNMIVFLTALSFVDAKGSGATHFRYC